MSPAEERTVGPPETVVPVETAEDLYEHAPCGYLSTLPDGTIVRVNQTLLSWTGHRRDELVDRRRFAELLSPGGRIYYETHLAPLLAMQGTVREIAVDVVRRDRRRLPVLLNAAVVRSGTGEPHLIRISVFDATDRRAYEQELLRARQRAEASEARARELAAALQASLIPPSPPVVPGLHVSAAYRPAGVGDEVGGDFYDVFETGSNDWAVALGDVRGKGAEAAAVTMLARHTIRAAAMRTRSPRAVLSTLNTALLRDRTDRFCTVVYLRLRFTRRHDLRVSLASGGHGLPLRITGDAVVPVGRHGSLLGIFDDPALHDTTVTLTPGEAMFVYTDGLPEARRGREFFGEERLRGMVADRYTGPTCDLAGAIVDEIVEFQHGTPRDDMAAVMVGVPFRD